MTSKIQYRRDTAANWTSVNPTLSAGEPSLETDTGKVKIGDGSTSWTSLAYFAGSGGGAVASVAGRTGAVTLTKTDVALANVDNTADTAKPVSTLQAAADTAAQAAAIAASQGAWTPVARTSAYTASVWDYVLADTTGGTFAVAAPSPTTAKQFGVKWKAGTVAPTLTGTFNSAALFTVLDQAMEFISDGTTWFRTVRPALAQIPDYPAITDARYSKVATVGVLASRPTADGTKAPYLATDDSGGTLYYDNASVWTAAGGPVVPVSPGPAYNITGSNFLKWRRALSKVRAGVADAKILCIGDSTTAGQSTTINGTLDAAYPGQLRSLMNSYYVPAVEGAFWSPGLTTGFDFTPRMTLGTGWTVAGTGAGGAFGVGYIAGATSAAGSLAITFPHTFDTITVYYFRNATKGTFTVNVDGGSSLGSVNAAGANADLTANFTCAAGTHTINITGPTGGDAVIFGVEAYLSTTRRVRVSNAGAGATKSADWSLVNSGTLTRGVLYNLYAPDLTIIALGINDAGASVAAGTYQTNMSAIITSAKAVGDVLLTSPVPSNGSPYTTFEPQYVAINKALATSLGVGFLDMSARWVDYATSNPLGYYSDSLHPTAFGYADWGQALFNVLKTI